MTPVSPVLPKQPETLVLERVIAKNQPEYQPLPAVVCSDGMVITRWKLTLRERLQVLFSGCFYFQQLTFNRPLQPQLPSVHAPIVEVSHAGV